MKLSRNRSEEQQRHVRENLSEEELVVFDILIRPGPDLTTDERNEVKKVARQLLDRLRQLLVLDWRRRSDARARVRLAIEDALDAGLPAVYPPDLYQRKVVAVFEHVYESYADHGSSSFSATA